MTVRWIVKIKNAVCCSRFNLGDASLIHYNTALCQKGDTSPGSYQDRKAAEKEMVKKEIEEAKQIAVKKAAEEKKNIEGALEMMQEAEKQAGGDHGGGLFAPLS